jgi:putative heme-binding domain-containing protein
MEALPVAAKDRLLALAGRWGKHDLFPEQSEAVVNALRADVANAALDAPKRASAARRLVSIVDAPPTIELLLKQISPTSPPEAQLGILEALGDSRSATLGATLTAQWGQLTPTAQKAALNLMLRKSAWTGALLDAIQSGKVHARDVLPQQWQVLTSNPDNTIAGRAKKLQTSVGGAPSADRAAIVKKMIHLADEPGDALKGRLVFEKNCLVCHTLGDKGGKVGPELTGVGARPKSDILLQVLDPNRSVEGNYRQWIVKTKNDIISGRINAESRTNIEIMDATGQLHHILREEILVLKPTDKGIMPEGLEALPEQDIKDLLEYLSQSKVKR